MINKAIQNDSNNPVYYYDLGNKLRGQGQLNEAISCYQKALQLRPDYVAAYLNLGNVLRDQGELNEAILCYQTVLRLRPDFAGAYNNLGNAFQGQGQLREAISCYQKALRLRPDYVVAHFNLGSAFQDQGKLNEAISCYEKALQVKPDSGIEVKTCLALPVICESKGMIDQFRSNLIRQLETLRNKGLALADPHKEVGSTHFLLAYNGLNDKEIQKQIASFYIHACPDLARTLSPINKQQRAWDRIRIGVVSRHLFDHTIGNISYGIIKHLSRQRFHVTLFRFPGKEDHLSRAINRSADEVIILPARLTLARKIIATHSLDILFYFDIGMEPLTYFLAFSRLAPVQCVTWGHPVTTGIPNVDYYISSETAEPPGAQDHYSERLVLLSRLAMYCYRPELCEEVPSRAEFGFSADHNLYVCPQSLFKFHPDFDAILGAILRRDPCGLLVLFQGRHKHWERLLRDRFARTFSEAINRVRFLPRMSKKDFLSFLRVADVILDTLHFTGGYSSLLAIACGVPIVTWPGTFMRGRLTMALYKQMEVMDCVAEDAQSYVNIAFRAANDKTWANEIKAKIKNCAHVLFEDIEAVHELERFFENALRQSRERNAVT